MEGGYTLVVRDLQRERTHKTYHYSDQLTAYRQYEAMNCDGYRYGKSLWLEPRPGRPKRQLIFRAF